jgi:hypothetical protein
MVNLKFSLPEMNRDEAHPHGTFVKAQISSFAGLALLACLASFEAQASNKPQQVFLSTVAALRNQDPSVTSVKVRFLEPSHNENVCGMANNDNALVLYCKRDRTIYASVNTLNLIDANYRLATVRYLAAHELAHGRQHAVTGFAKELVWSSVLDELQADCIAGSYLRIAYGYTPESSQGEAVRRFAYEIGDRAYFHHDWHGKPRWRAAAVSLGMRTGEPARCLSSKNFNYGSLLDSGSEILGRWRKP